MESEPCKKTGFPSGRGFRLAEPCSRDPVARLFIHKLAECVCVARPESARSLIGLSGGTVGCGGGWGGVAAVAWTASYH
jgi:hypothetical protein